MKNEITINKIKFRILKNENDAIDKDELSVKFTDFFENYDFIVGDWAYGKLRLKGFNKKQNKNYRLINDFKDIENYINNYCAYGCKHFVLEKLEVEK